MLAELLLLDDQELNLESCRITEDGVNVTMTARQMHANYPQCETASSRVHSSYLGKRMELLLPLYPHRNHRFESIFTH